MFASLQNPLTLVGRLLLALLFVPAGISKISGFAGTVGYIQSGGLPAPQLAAVVAILVEVVGGLALVAGFGTRIAARAATPITAGSTRITPSRSPIIMTGGTWASVRCAS